MRARVLRTALAALIAGAGVGLGLLSAHAETTEAEAEPQRARESGAAAARNSTAAQRRRARNEAQRRQIEEWWTHAREVLFSDVELNPEQTRGVEAAIEEQLRARRRVPELRAELGAAQRRGDAERGTALRAELKANREQIKRPNVRIEQLRALLSKEQHPTFDMNRARLAAEGQQERKQRKRRGRRPEASTQRGAE